MILIECVSVVCPRAIEQARRLEFAIRQLQAGATKHDVTRMVMERYHCSQPTAWRVVDMANDLAGKT